MTTTPRTPDPRSLVEELQRKLSAAQETNVHLSREKSEAIAQQTAVGEVLTVRATLSNAVTMIRERAAGHGIGLDLSVEGIDFISADERKVKQILFNLLSNAVKFTPDGGSITVRAVRQDSETLVSVSDTGSTVPVELQFEAFASHIRAARPRHRAAPGRLPDPCGSLLMHRGRWRCRNARAHPGGVAFLTRVGGLSSYGWRGPLQPPDGGCRSRCSHGRRGSSFATPWKAWVSTAFHCPFPCSAEWKAASFPERHGGRKVPSPFGFIPRRRRLLSGKVRKA